MHLPEHIHYRYASLSEVPAEAVVTLSEDERRYVESLRLEKRRWEFVAGRWVMRNLAATVLDTGPLDVPLNIRDDGSLELIGVPFNVSLAHSRSGVVAVISRGGEVGIDLEEIKPRSPDLLRFMLHESEYALLETLPVDKDRILILIWTLKEAVLKGMRTGFRCSPKKLRVSIDHARGEAEIYAPESRIWQARFEERSGNYLTIAYSRG